MTIAHTSIMAIFVIQRIDEHKVTYSIVPSLFAGPVTISYWRFFDGLRPYALVQFVPCIVIPLMAILLRPMYTHSTYWLWAAGFYILAKVEEAVDKPIYSWTHNERISLYKTWKISWTRNRSQGSEEERFEYSYSNVAVEETR